ncbi:hypothetical protein D3C71_1410870 [compost metagenome]
MQTLHVLRRIEYHFFAIGSHQIIPILQREGLHHPIGEAGNRNFQSEASILIQLNCIFLQLFPVLRAFLRVQPRFLEHILVIVEHDGAALERNTVCMPLRLRIGEKGRIEIRQILLAAFFLDEIIQRNDRVHIQQAEQLG